MPPTDDGWAKKDLELFVELLKARPPLRSPFDLDFVAPRRRDHAVSKRAIGRLTR